MVRGSLLGPSMITVCAGLLAVAAPARAQVAPAPAPPSPTVERAMVVTLSGAIGGGVAVDQPDYDPYGKVIEPDPIGLARVFLSWEPPILDYREPRGYLWRGQLVPELQLGTLYVDGDREELVGAGLRLELAFSQRRMGLLQVSGRGGMYVAGRAALLTDAHHTPVGEGAIGTYFWVGNDVRIGAEMGVTTLFVREPDYVIYDATARLPWADQGGPYLIVDAGVTVGMRL